MPRSPQTLDFLFENKRHDSKDFPLLFSDRPADTLSEGFCILPPFYEFLCKAQELD